MSLEDVEEKAREWEVNARAEQEEEESGRKLLRLQDISLKDVVMVVGSITTARMILRYLFVFVFVRRLYLSMNFLIWVFILLM